MVLKRFYMASSDKQSQLQVLVEEALYGMMVCVQIPLKRPRTHCMTAFQPMHKPQDCSQFCSILNNMGDHNSKRIIPPQPPAPTAWYWRCHLCHQKYQLGVTRRCLTDGHRICSTFSDEPLKKHEKNKHCLSKFDYRGWSEWYEWRKSVRKRRDEARRRAAMRRLIPQAIPKRPKTHNCWDNCKYPSMCVHDNLKSPAASSPDTSEEDEPPRKTKKSER